MSTSLKALAIAALSTFMSASLAFGADASDGVSAAAGGTAVETGYAPVNGLGMYYEIHGEGEPLVLLHGAYTTLDISFGALIPALSAERQVIALEQQGHGRTADVDRPLSYEQMADDTATLLRHLGVERADVMGYSMGANTALELAIRHPDLVDRIVVVSGYADPAGLYPGVMEGIAQITPDVFVGSGLPETYAQVAPDPDDWPTLIEKVKALDLGFAGIPDEDIAAIAAPALIVVGDSDIVSTRHATELFELLGGGLNGDFEGLPDAQLAVLPGTTHIGVLMEQGEMLASMVDAFLESSAAAG